MAFLSVDVCGSKEIVVDGRHQLTTGRLTSSESAMKKKVYFFTHFSFSFSLVDVTEITILKNNRKSFEIPTLLSLD